MNGISIQPIGSRPCEIVLVKILNEHQDRKLITKVTGIYHDFRSGLRCLTALDKDYRYRMMCLFRQATLDDIKNRNFPKEVASHLRCVLAAIFRDTLREMRNEQS